MSRTTPDWAGSLKQGLKGKLNKFMTSRKWACAETCHSEIVSSAMNVCWIMNLMNLPLFIFFTFAFLLNVSLLFSSNNNVKNLFLDLNVLSNFPFLPFILSSLRNKNQKCDGATENSIRNSNPCWKWRRKFDIQGNGLWKECLRVR